MWLSSFSLCFASSAVAASLMSVCQSRNLASDPEDKSVPDIYHVATPGAAQRFESRRTAHSLSPVFRNSRSSFAVTPKENPFAILSAERTRTTLSQNSSRSTTRVRRVCSTADDTLYAGAR
eukprot:2855552-Prymnesium_polylepis.1